MMTDIYTFITPILLAIIGTVGMFAAKALFQISKDLNEIKVLISALSTQQKAHEIKLEKHEEKIDELTIKLYANGIKK